MSIYDVTICGDKIQSYKYITLPEIPFIWRVDVRQFGIAMLSHNNSRFIINIDFKTNVLFDNIVRDKLLRRIREDNLNILLYEPIFR